MSKSPQCRSLRHRRSCTYDVGSLMSTMSRHMITMSQSYDVDEKPSMSMLVNNPDGGYRGGTHTHTSYTCQAEKKSLW